MTQSKVEEMPVLAQYFYENIVDNDYFYHRLAFWAHMLIGKNIHVNVNTNGESFTNGDTITISPSKEDMVSPTLNEVFKDMPEVMKAYLIGLTIHESEHVISSDFNAFRAYLDATEKDLQKRDILCSQLMDVRHFIANAIEDGRIERRVRNRLPGTSRYLDVINFSLFNDAKCTGVEVTDVINNVLAIAKTGKMIAGTKETLKDSFAYDILLDVQSNIMNAVNSDDPTFAMNQSWEVYIKLIPIFEKYVKDQCNTLDMLLDRILGQISNDIDKSMQNDKNDQVGNDIQSSIKLPLEDNTEDASDSESKNSNSNNSENNTEGKKGSSSSIQSSQEEGENQSTEESSKQETKKESQSMTSATEPDIEEEMQIWVSEFKKEIKEAIQEVERLEAKEKIEEEQAKQANIDNQEDIAEVAKHVRLNKGYRAVIVDKSRSSHRVLSSTLKREGKALQRELNDILKNKFQEKERHLRRGSLDRNALTPMVVYHKDNVFYKRERNEIEDYVFYLMIDASGSMSHGSLTQAKSVAAIVEEGLRGIAPLRIDFFNSCELETTFYRVKDFDDIRKESVQYTDVRADNWNCDSYALHAAKEAIQKRPETNKIIFMVTDGLPSYSCQGLDPDEEAREAVKEIRKENVHLIPIAITDENKRSNFQQIYGSDIIVANYSTIKKQIIKTIKTMLSL